MAPPAGRLGAAAVPACRVDDGAPMILLCVGLVIMQGLDPVGVKAGPGCCTGL